MHSASHDPISFYSGCVSQSHPEFSAVVSLFSLLCNITTYDYVTIYLLHSSAYGHLSCLQFLYL